MKMRVCVVLVLLISLALSGACETENDIDLLISSQEESVFADLKGLAMYTIESEWKHILRVDRESDAWKRLMAFDDGFFAKSRVRGFSDMRTFDWEYVSDTECLVSAECNLTVKYSQIGTEETFHCAYRIRYSLNERKKVWYITDFWNLESERDKALAARVTAEQDGITLNAVCGHTYTGYMLVIDDPSRVFVGTIDKFGTNARGLRIDAMTEKYASVGGFNGGAFEDPVGTVNGGMPSGIVYSEGEKLREHKPHKKDANVIMGFDNNDKLIVGKFTNDEANELNLRDALAFSPALIVDGVALDVSGERLRYTTRTVIGQDAEGRVLVLIVHGRQPDSYGACLEDAIDIMLEYGAVTAGNLDGGMSTCLYMGGESIYSGYSLDVSRALPAAFLIKPAE